MIDIIDKKQMYDSVIMGKVNALKSGIVLQRCFWRVLTSVLCWVMHILCVNALNLLSGFFWWRHVGNLGCAYHLRYNDVTRFTQS